MTNFPYYNHFVIKIIFTDATEVVESKINQLLDQLVSALHLTVVEGLSHPFPVQGWTTVLILSQSHLICHAWPEDRAVHLDLMTCTSSMEIDLLSNLFSQMKAEVEVVKIVSTDA